MDDRAFSRRPSPENELLFMLDILLLRARTIVPLGSVLRKEPAQAQAAAPPCQPYSAMPCCPVSVHRRLLPHLSPMSHLDRCVSPLHSAALFFPFSHLSITHLMKWHWKLQRIAQHAHTCIHTRKLQRVAQHAHTHARTLYIHIWKQLIDLVQGI